MKFNPHDYQKYAIEYIKSHPIAAVLLDMGLGKTVITLTAINDRWRNRPPRGTCRRAVRRRGFSGDCSDRRRYLCFRWN